MPLRLRINFCRTIAEREYDGLRLSVLHPERGTIDMTILAFADHDTFTERDARRGNNYFGEPKGCGREQPGKAALERSAD